jgi:hypothetical protein
MRMRRHITSTRAVCALALAAVGLMLSVLTSTASASITPKLTLDQSGGTSAGATHALGLNMTFSPSSASDSPKTLTIKLPRGLLASASADGGACLNWTSSSTPPAACEVGTGTASAKATLVILPVPAQVKLTFYIVAPPKPGDLAGLYVQGTGTGIPAGLLGNLGQIGSTGDITVGTNAKSLSIALGLPNTVDGLPTSIDSIDSTFSAIRYPTTCPATPERVSIASNSYSVSTVKTASAPLKVTGCSSLPFAPKYSSTFTKDATNKGVQVVSTITQTADQVPNSAMTLKFPQRALTTNLGVVKLLCKKVTSGTCKPVGSATAVSPLYPAPLTGAAYLTGQALAPDLTIVFPSPFPITLTGSVNLNTYVTKFTGLPDIPLTNLKVTLNGTSDSPFNANCSHKSGTTSAAFTAQNGTKATASQKVTLIGCAAKKSK